MTAITALPAGLLTALERAKRTPGWNMRSDTVQHFDVQRRFGDEPCTVIVVPCRVWAYRCWQKQKAYRNRSETVSETLHGGSP